MEINRNESQEEFFDRLKREDDYAWCPWSMGDEDYDNRNKKKEGKIAKIIRILFKGFH